MLPVDALKGLLPFPVYNSVLISLLSNNIPFIRAGESICDCWDYTIDCTPRELSVCEM